MKKIKCISKLMKKATKKQINDAIDERCIFLCYQPKLPNSMKCKKIMNNNKVEH